MTSTRADEPSTTRRSWVVLVLILVVAAVLVGVAVSQSREEPADGGTSASTSPEQPSATVPEDDDGPVAGTLESPQPATLDMARRDPEDPLAAGPVDAPVVMVVYSDYQCPFCAVWSDRTLPEMQPYVDAGDLRIEWRDVNVYGPDSARAARAAYAAGLQDRFLEYHHALFADGETRSPRELTDDALLELAETLGLDADRFAADVASPEVGDAVLENADEGASIGAFSTPSFLVGGAPVVGAQPTEVFVAAVEEALAQADG